MFFCFFSLRWTSFSAKRLHKQAPPPRRDPGDASHSQLSGATDNLQEKKRLDGSVLQLENEFTFIYSASPLSTEPLSHCHQDGTDVTITLRLSQRSDH